MFVCFYLHITKSPTTNNLNISFISPPRELLSLKQTVSSLKTDIERLRQQVLARSVVARQLEELEEEKVVG